jgi:tetratricopeptide (TPR) repeat protein
VTGRYVRAFASIQDKVDGLRHAELENERLSMENANLRTTLEAMRFERQETNAKNLTEVLERKLTQDAGSRLARTIANITYRVPGNMLPGQLYPLAVSYFKAHEDEKAAVILSFLTGLEEDQTYQTPRNFLMTGVAWYRVDNVDLADSYFERALKTPEVPENLQVHAQARLWRGLASERMGKHAQAQGWLRDLMDHHPHSTEAAWVNRGRAGPPPGLPAAVHGEATRETASEH